MDPDAGLAGVWQQKKVFLDLDYKIEWDYISIESGAEENLIFILITRASISKFICQTP